MKKIDKRSCRKVLDPAGQLNLNHGVFYAESISYIVRTAVKNIGHQRLLVLYVYSRKEAVNGSFLPKWTVFQSKNDYITLERKDDGTTIWRTAAFLNLDREHYRTYRSACYSMKDDKRISNFFQRDGDGLKILNQVQNEIQHRRRRERQCIREREIISRMKNLPPLPKGVEPWIRKSIMPAYFFYDYKKGKKKQKGICSACGTESALENVKHNMEGICPHCHHRIIMKARGRRVYLYDRETCQVIQRVGESEVVIRVLKVCYLYHRKETIQKENFYEAARIFVRLNEKGRPEYESFYYDFGKGILTKWKKGERPRISMWQESYEADLCGHVYCNNLGRALPGTPWQYCPVQLFYERFHRPMELIPFLAGYLRHPRMEHLVKMGFYALVTEMVYGYSHQNFLDETQNRTHRILKVAAEDIPYLRDIDVSEQLLRMFQEYYRLNLKDRQRLLDWQIKNKVQRDVLSILAYMTVHKMIRYLDEQNSFLCVRKTQHGTLRYKNMQEVVSEYRDYLDMCQKQKYDMRNSFVLYPRDLQKAHDKVAHRIKLKADAKLRKDFKIAYQRIMKRLDFEWNSMKIVYPSSPEEIIAEGHALHHCVGSYVDRVAKKECIILFLRLCEEITKPFYTIEVRNQKVIQVRGMKNDNATPEVQKFMDRWTSRVLQAPAVSKAA